MASQSQHSSASLEGNSFFNAYMSDRISYGLMNNNFQKPEPKIPYKAISLAVGLFSLGTLLIIIGILLLTGIIDVKYSDWAWPVLILGSLLFIPGAYHIRIAFYAFRRYKGYSFDYIPEFE